MKALTLTQPWATLVAIGAKRIETRSWATSYRGLLAIHAAQGYVGLSGPAGFMGRCNSEPFKSALATAGLTHRDLPRGAIVAVCRLVDCVPTCGDGYYRDPDRRVIMQVDDQERAFGDYSLGRYAWLLADIQRLLEPIPYKGMLGLWEPDLLTQMAIKRQQIEAIQL